MGNNENPILAFEFGVNDDIQDIELPDGMSVIDLNRPRSEPIEMVIPNSGESPDNQNSGYSSSHDEEIDLIELFEHLNSRESKVSWDDRFKVIKSQLPHVDRIPWEDIFRSDPTILGDIVNDVMKRRLAPQGRPGKRPGLDREEALDLLNQFRGEGYSIAPFTETFDEIRGKLSVRKTAERISMSPTYTHGLLTGTKEPSITDMEMIANAFNRHPSVFYEYRVAFVLAAIAERMDWAPESSVLYYERVKDVVDASS